MSNAQFGFRKCLSTQDALIDLITEIEDKVDKGDKCLVAVFLDLMKAFDTVSVHVYPCAQA